MILRRAKARRLKKTSIGRSFVSVALHTDLSLWERDRDSVFFERIPKRQIDVAPDIGQPSGGVLDPEAQDIVDRTVAETNDMTDCRPEIQNPIDALRRLNRDLSDLMRIVAIRGAKINIEADKLV